MTPLDDLKLFCMDRSLAHAELSTVAATLDFEIVPTRSDGTGSRPDVLSAVPVVASVGSKFDGGALRDLLLP